MTAVLARRLLAAVLLVLLAGCAKAPPTLSPEGVRDYNTLRAVRVLDLVRDTAIDAHAQTPPLIATEHARIVVRWHKAALTTITAVPDGWLATVLAGIDQLQTELPPDVWAKISVYITLAKTVIQEVGR